jgi:hypothetical protein
MGDLLKTKGRELLVLLIAVAMLLQVISGVVMDSILTLMVGAWGWFMSNLGKD